MLLYPFLRMKRDLLIDFDTKVGKSIDILRLSDQSIF